MKVMVVIRSRLKSRGVYVCEKGKDAQPMLFLAIDEWLTFFIFFEIRRGILASQRGQQM